MERVHLRLFHSESVVVQAAAQIYAARLMAGQADQPEEAIEQSIQDAIRIARRVDESVVSDQEMA